MNRNQTKVKPLESKTSKKLLTQITEKTEEKQKTEADEGSDEEHKEMELGSFNRIMSQGSEFQLDLDKLVQTTSNDIQMQFEPKIFR